MHPANITCVLQGKSYFVCEHACGIAWCVHDGKGHLFSILHSKSTRFTNNLVLALERWCKGNNASFRNLESGGD